MKKTLITDFSRVLLFSKDKNYEGGLNDLYRKIIDDDSKFFEYFELNNDLLSYYKSLKNKLDLFLFTSEIIQQAPPLQKHLKPIFKGIYSALKMNTNKKEERAYHLLIKELGLAADETIYVDDLTNNIVPASKAGLYTIQYKNNEDLIKKIDNLLSQP